MGKSFSLRLLWSPQITKLLLSEICALVYRRCTIDWRDTAVLTVAIANRDTTMGRFVPHDALHLSLVRTTDLWFLLVAGALYELLTRFYLLFVCKLKSPAQLQLEAQLVPLKAETDRKRKLGPQAFVETSKLERQVLQLEKQISDIRSKREKRKEQVEKILVKGGNFRLSVLIGLLYYSVPLLQLDAISTAQHTGVTAETLLKNLMFPLSSISGLGYRIANYGLADEYVGTSLGALLALWSSQMTVGKLMDAVDAYYLCD